MVAPGKYGLRRESKRIQTVSSQIHLRALKYQDSYGPLVDPRFSCAEFWYFRHLRSSALDRVLPGIVIALRLLLVKSSLHQEETG